MSPQHSHAARQRGTEPAAQRGVPRSSPPTAAESELAALGEMLNAGCTQHITQLQNAMQRGVLQRMKIGGRDVPRDRATPEGVSEERWRAWLSDPALEFVNETEMLSKARMADAVAATPHPEDRALVMDAMLRTPGSSRHLEEVRERKSGVEAHQRRNMELISRGYLRDVEQHRPSLSGDKSSRYVDTLARIGGEDVVVESKDFDPDVYASRERREPFRSQLHDYLLSVEQRGERMMYVFDRGLPDWAAEEIRTVLRNHPEIETNLPLYEQSRERYEYEGQRAVYLADNPHVDPATVPPYRPQTAFVNFERRAATAPAPARATTTTTTAPVAVSSPRPTLGPPLSASPAEPPRFQAPATASGSVRRPTPPAEVTAPASTRTLPHSHAPASSADVRRPVLSRPTASTASTARADVAAPTPTLSLPHSHAPASSRRPVLSRPPSALASATAASLGPVDAPPEASRKRKQEAEESTGKRPRLAAAPSAMEEATEPARRTRS